MGGGRNFNQISFDEVIMTLEGDRIPNVKVSKKANFDVKLLNNWKFLSLFDEGR